MILAGDVGGTKSVLGLFEKAGAALRQVHERTYRNEQFSSFEAILADFLAEGTGPDLAVGCFGVAGTVIDGHCRLTNIDWEMEEKELARLLKAPHVKLLNDLEAAAYGMLFLRDDELSVLNAGREAGRTGNVAVVAAGTGLGEAMLFWDGAWHHPIASEGGHADFAPRNDQEIALLRYLSSKVGGHVSYERILSGPGIFNLYRFLRDTEDAIEPAWLREKLERKDPSITVSEVGLAGKDPLCVATLEIFASIYGAEAGNLALKCLAVGGVFVGGGIAPKILPVLQKGGFMRAFADKGRFAGLLKGWRVSVATNPRSPLLGAAHYALRL
jgi:glucokinase